MKAFMKEGNALKNNSIETFLHKKCLNIILRHKAVPT